MDVKVQHIDGKHLVQKVRHSIRSLLQKKIVALQVSLHAQSPTKANKSAHKLRDWAKRTANVLKTKTLLFLTTSAIP